MEHSIGSIISKLDAVLVRIGVMSECEFSPIRHLYVKWKILSAPDTGEDAGNAAFILDMTDQGQIEDFVPGDGTDGNATFV